MNLRAGYPFSLVKSGLPFDCSKLEKDTRTDVLLMVAVSPGHGIFSFDRG